MKERCHDVSGAVRAIARLEPTAPHPGSTARLSGNADVLVGSRRGMPTGTSAFLENTLARGERVRDASRFPLKQGVWQP